MDQADSYVVRSSEQQELAWVSYLHAPGLTLRTAYAKFLAKLMSWQVPEEEGIWHLDFGTRLRGLYETDDTVFIAYYAFDFLGDVDAESGHWPQAVRLHGRLQEIPEQRLSSQRGLAEFEDCVRHLHDLLVELGRNIEDTDQRLASGVRVKRALQEIVSTAADQRLRPHRELATLMLDAVRHVPSEDLTVRHLSAVQECTDRLSETELTHEHLAACDSALLAAGLDSLPDLGDDDE